jgi:hypothetical protein
VQVSYLLSGLFARACKSLGSAAAQDSVDNILGEVRQLRNLLTGKLGQINSNLEGEAPPGVQRFALFRLLNAETAFVSMTKATEDCACRQDLKMASQHMDVAGRCS